ncbi:MAG: polysaccharide deacetylase family protein [Acidimicrobiales bacterium]|nr:polysaccharide deacetylase family protein [Acidimicrobiales bacterium]MCB1247884.1 polysaccharide deacetylase family protein [Acidimicrobiales bacterium]MCB1261716.1 polysaccharide deacetylase family protein [Acidimicrobiales bacterium]
MTGPGRPFCITIDVEDHRADASMPMRVPALVDQLLAWLDDRAIRATAFVVGSLAAEHPDVVRRIAAQGHELALHNWEHVHLTTQDEDSFRAGLLRGKAVLEDLSGRPCTGFRAPTGSLVPSTMWCTDVLAEVGFHYDSSVFPGRNQLFGFPGAPRTPPFRWPSGLVEVGQFVVLPNPFSVPMGGTFLRVLPWPALALGVRLHPPAQTSCVYLHPYDIDLEETPWKVPEAGAASRLLFMGRRGLLTKLDRLVRRLGTAPPLGEQVEQLDPQALPLFDPPLSAGATRLRAGRR